MKPQLEGSRGAVAKLSSNRGALEEVKSQKQTRKKAILPCPKSGAEGSEPGTCTRPQPQAQPSRPLPPPHLVTSLLRFRQRKGCAQVTHLGADWDLNPGLDSPDTACSPEASALLFSSGGVRRSRDFTLDQGKVNTSPCSSPRGPHPLWPFQDLQPIPTQHPWEESIPVKSLSLLLLTSKKKKVLVWC